MSEELQINPPIGIAPTKRSFAEIADDLSAYQETLELVLAKLAAFDPLPVEAEEVKQLIQERGELMLHLERIGKELASKTDACAAVIRRLDSDIEEIKAEQERLTLKRKTATKALDWLKGYIMAVMKQNGQTKLKTPLNTISVRGNGGKLALTISHPELVPDEFCHVAVAMPWKLWCKLQHEIGDSGWATDYADKLKWERIPKAEAIRAEIEKLCPFCDGECSTDIECTEPCPQCHGTGKSTVEGAKLEPRGEHLEVR